MLGIYSYRPDEVVTCMLDFLSSYYFTDDGEMIFKMEEIIPATEENVKSKTILSQPLSAKPSSIPTSSVPSVPSATSIASSTSSQRSSTRSRNDPKFTAYHVSLFFYLPKSFSP